MVAQTDTIASFNELAAYFRQRRAAEDGDHWYGASWYEGGIDQWISWPDWLHARCEDRYSALDAGRCCRDSGNVAVRRALNLADVARDVLATFDRGGRDCEETGAYLSALVDAAAQVVPAIRADIAVADRALAVQLACALDRVSLFTARLAGRRGCPWRCTEHPNPDRGADLAALREQIDECSGAIWDALHPRSGAAREVRT
ncbi:MAG: hypothetical protein J2P25_15715 [Nocardiopsaceae bacterium]|nr:hypothetical protein [Nocardiopsaceae bacterium]